MFSDSRAALAKLKALGEFRTQVNTVLASAEGQATSAPPSEVLMSKDLDVEKPYLKIKRKDIVNHVITPGFIVEAIIENEAHGYYILSIQRILSVTVDEFE